MEIANSMILLLKLCPVSLHYSRRIFAKKLIPPFINITIDEAVEKLKNHFCMLRKTICSSYSYIAFKLRVNGADVVKSWQLLGSYGAIFGGSYPNHFWGVTKISDD